MRKTAIPFAILVIGVSLSQSPVFGADQANTGKSATAGGQHALPVAQYRSTANDIVAAPAARAHKIENVPLALNKKPRGENRSPAAGTESARSDTKLALLETAPSRNAASGASPPEEQWLRISESPQPGSWAILLAGFLGICAVARPRIFSS